MEEIIKKLLDEGYAVKLYENALGTITAEGQSTASEMTINEEPDSFGLLKETPWGVDRIKSVKLVGEVITDGKTIIEALRALLMVTIAKNDREKTVGDKRPYRQQPTKSIPGVVACMRDIYLNIFDTNGKQCARLPYSLK